MVRRFVFLAGASCALACVLGAQTLTTGDVTGTITDQTGGVLAKVKVTLKNTGTGATQNTQTNTDGVYRFSFVAPGPYSVTAAGSGFQTMTRNTQVGVGQTAAVDFQLALASSTTTVEVTEAAVAVQTDNANLTTNVNLAEVQNLPNPGNDLTYYAQTAPGVVMNTTPGYGNFSAFGLPATSNVFTINGQVNNDVFLNLNNSGASNLMLGFNEIQEAAIVNNGYTGQYGGLAGTQMNMVSKSGSNAFHGNAIYYWNGREMNANNFFNNASDTPRAFSNVNMWATSVGGPIQKDKTFFFVDYEGLRIVLPTDVLVRIPTTQFANATLANLQSTGQTAAIPFYQNMFKLYAGAPGSANATPVAGGGCGTFTGLGGAPCAQQFRSTIGNFTKEYLWTARVDHNFSDLDRAYVRIQRDNGTQPTYTDPINPIFNAFSPQPEMNGQIAENHTFGATSMNNFILSGQFYSARFGSSNPAAVTSTFPTTVQFSGSLFYGLNNEGYAFPQGRNVTQYQVIDDYSKSAGRHNLKAGLNFHRVDLTDFSFEEYTAGRITLSNLGAFYNGGGAGSRLIQRFPTSPEEPLAFYNLGAYVQDEWQFGRLKIIPTLRIDHNSNPVCQTNCFARMVSPFDALSHNPNIPYDQVIQNGLHQAFQSTDPIIWQPRIGFAFTPTKSGNTVLRGGFGIFGDTFPGTAAEAFARNTPALNSFTVTNGAITPGAPNNLFSIASSANQSLLNGFKNGGTLASISASNPFFVPPNYTTMEAKYHQARYMEWNLEVQQALPGKMMFSVNYVGNHGYHEFIGNGGLNGYLPGFPGLPATAPDPRFGTINQYDTGAYSNYNGLVASIRRRFSGGFMFQASYTYSHSLDIVSNGGFEPLAYVNAGSTNNSVLAPQDPYNIRLYNYGNSDYDVRHYADVSYVWDDMFRHMFKGGPNILFGGWVLSGTIFARSGMPFTVIDNMGTATLESNNFNAVPGTGPMFLFATPLQAGFTTCGSAAVNTPCLSPTQFTPPTSKPTSFGNQARNQYRGPNYFDTDLSVMKAFPLGHWEAARFSVGFQFFNLFNHPNFDKPVGDVSDPNFGSIINVVSPPTSILGSFAGADASGRIIQLKAQIVF
jgi:hypothetical protein